MNPIHAIVRVVGRAVLAGSFAMLLFPGAGAGAVAPSRAPSLRDSPGYRPLVDPDSASVRAGRMLNAPLVSRPFDGGARSMEELGRRVCRAVHRDQPESLLALTVTRDEFREILWPEFTQSRKATGLTWEDGWTALGNRLQAGSRQATQDFGGRWVEFVRFERDTVSRYRNFSLHQRLVMVVRDDTGALQRWSWLRAVAERKGRFKIYSTTD